MFRFHIIKRWRGHCNCTCKNIFPDIHICQINPIMPLLKSTSSTVFEITRDFVPFRTPIFFFFETRGFVGVKIHLYVLKCKKLDISNYLRSIATNVHPWKNQTTWIMYSRLYVLKRVVKTWLGHAHLLDMA